MYASFINNIHGVDPQLMLNNVVYFQRTGCLRRKTASHSSASPFPHSIEQHILYLLLRARVYMDYIQLFDNTAHMYSPGKVDTDPSAIPRMIISENIHTPPSYLLHVALNGLGV